MLNTAFRILNNRQDAEDVVQESFLKAFSRLEQFNSESTFGSWIRRIVVNRSIDALKRQNKNIFLTELNGAESMPEEILNRDQHLSDQQKLDRLHEALHQLPDGYRTVLSLYMLEGYDHEEISTILNIGVSTSISQLSRAKKKLKWLIIKIQDHD
jgi:RNA polymerase sigma-70 factor (ECF subfamily)